MAEYLRYLRIRYKHLGRGWEEGDCWNLVRMFYANELGIGLSDFTDYGENWANEGYRFLEEMPSTMGFSQVEEIHPGDALIFRYRGLVYHCGVALEAPWFLHTHKGGTSINDYQSGVWALRFHAAWRHQQRVK